MPIPQILFLDEIVQGAISKVRATRQAKFAFHFFGTTSAGTGNAVLDIEASADGTKWVRLGGITLALTVAGDQGGVAFDAPWTFVRGNLLTLTGTDAKVTLKLME